MHTKRTTKRGRRKKETHQDELKKYGDWRTALYMYVGTLCFHFNFILFYGMSPYGTSPSTNAFVSYNILYQYHWYVCSRLIIYAFITKTSGYIHICV